MKEKQNKRKKMLLLGITLVVLLAIVLANTLTNKSTTQKDITQSNPLGGSYDPTTQEPNITPETGKVIIQYLDESGTSIATTETIEGEIGTEYSTSRKSIEHYISNGDEPVNKIGNYKEDDITVIYVYKKASDVVNVETDGNNITLKVENVIQNREYKLLLEQESTEGDKLSGGQFSLVDVKFEDQLMEGATVNGSLVLGSVNVSNEVNELYAISEDKAPEGYELAMKDKRYNINLIKSYNQENKVYELKATSGDTDYELEEDDENSTITVKVVNEKIKTYDLAVKTFANSIDGTATNRNVTARVTTTGEIEYDETEQNLTVKDGQKVIYTIRIYNEKNQDMAGQVVTQTLPKGLKFLSDSEINTTNGWSLNEGKLTTSKLVGKTIAGIDTSKETEVKYEELKLELEVDEDNATDGTVLTTTSSIPVDDKESNSENNQDSETVNLQKQTPVYDLAVKKYATQINNTDTGRKVEATINNLKQIVLEETNPDKEIKNNQKIVYTIRVYNVGNQDLKGTKLTDVIPAGLKFDSSSSVNTQYGWTKNGNNIETTYLENRPVIKAVKPYKGELPNYEELKVEFTFDEYSAPDDTNALTNEIQLAKATNETNDLNNTDTDIVSLDRTKTYDFVLKKFATKINNTDTGRSVTAKLNDSKQVEYVENRPDKTIKDEQKVIYTIRVYNEGNQNMAGKKITDTVPTGLKLVEYRNGDNSINDTYKWKQNGDKIESTYLVGKTIEGSKSYRDELPKYIDLQVEMVVVEDDTDDSVTSLTNTATIEKGDNETDESDNTDEDTITLERREKTYDFVMKKFASKIDNTDTGRNVTVSLTDSKEIKFTETKPAKTVSEGQKVIYTLRVFNAGNQALKGTKVTEDLPTGLKFVQNSTTNTEYKWSVVNGKLESTYLTDKTINGCRTDKDQTPNYLDLFVELEVTREGLDRLSHQITNTATIAQGENEKSTDLTNNTATDQITLEANPYKDLGVRKFAASVNGTATGSNITSKINNGKVEYEVTDVRARVEDEQKIIYIIRVFNLGEQALTATQITENVPAGLKFLPNSTTNTKYNWEQSNGNLITNYLTGKTIPVLNPQDASVKNYLDVEVEFEVVEDDITTGDEIENTVRIAENEKDEDNSNNTSSYVVDLKRKEKTYDFVMKKFASKINNANTGRNVTVSLTNAKEIKYTETRPEKTVSEGQKVIYTLRVFNEGNQPLKGTKVTEDLPKGLKFVQNSTTNTEYQWTVVDGKLETNYLTDKTINGCRTDKGETPNYIDLFVELEVTREGLDRLSHLITNTATIAQGENEKTTDLSNNTGSDSITLEANPYKDLGVEKFAATIDNEETGRNVTAKIDDQGKIEIEKTDVEKQVKDTQKIVYIIRVFNLGEQALTATKITEEIPAGLKYLPNSEINRQYNWQESGNNVTTDYITGQNIPALNSSVTTLKNYLDVKIELEVVEESANANNKITNKVTITENEKDENSSNNTATDTVDLVRKVKTYDLAMKKFTYSVDGTKLEKEITASVDTNGNIVFANDDTRTTVQKSQTVVFTLRIFNLGNQPMVGKQITDTLPNDVTFVENSTINQKYNWQVSGSTLTTDYLVGKTIPGFDIEQGEVPAYTDLQVECKVSDETIREHKTMTNIAKIDEDEKDQNKSNNTGTATLIAEAEKIRVSDLSMQKFLYSVDGEVLKDREIIAKNVDGKIEYTKNNDIYKVSNNQSLIYTLRIYNVGDGETNGRQVVEYLPAGLEFVENSKINTANGWVMCKLDKAGNLVEVTDSSKATVLKSDKLLTENILGFEVNNNEVPKYKDVQVELKVNEDKLTSEDRIITNIAQIEKSTTEPDSENDKAEEKVQVKIFDLNVTKYIRTIEVKEGNEIVKTQNIGLENKGKIYKVEVDQKKIGNTQVIVTYGLKVKNIGEIPGYATELTDYFPQDLYLSSTSTTWKIDGKEAKSEEIANKLIVPGDSTTVEVTFVCDVTEDCFGVKDNTAIISAYKNDYNAKDPTPDKDNNEKFIISIKTGASIGITFAIVFVVLVLIAIGIKLKLIKLPKNNKKRK